jgi:hypothetical protein
MLAELSFQAVLERKKIHGLYHCELGTASIQKAKIPNGLQIG